jgi:hypothetical protein
MKGCADRASAVAYAQTGAKSGSDGSFPLGER